MSHDVMDRLRAADPIDETTLQLTFDHDARASFATTIIASSAPLPARAVPTRRGVRAVVVCLLGLAVVTALVGAVVVLARDDAAPTHVTSAPAPPAAMPKEVVATRSTDGAVVVLRTGDGTLVRTLVPGKGPGSVVTDGNSAVTQPTGFAPSADGRFVYYETEGPNPNSIQTANGSRCSIGTIFRVPLAGGDAERITYGGGPAPSPDGRYLAFLRQNDTTVTCAASATVVVRDLTSGTERVVSAAAGNTTPTWRGDSELAWREITAPDHERPFVWRADTGQVQAGEFLPDQNLQKGEVVGDWDGKVLEETFGFETGTGKDSVVLVDPTTATIDRTLFDVPPGATLSAYFRPDPSMHTFLFTMQTKTAPGQVDSAAYRWTDGDPAPVKFADDVTAVEWLPDGR